MAARRVTKNPEERRCELVEAAGRLFISKGYEETAVSDIVREVKVSQGAFYYYFPSKEDVLVAVLKRNLELMEQDVETIARRDDLDETEKLNLIFNRFIQVGVSGKAIFSYIHQHKSATLHQKLAADNPFAKIAPLVAEVIARGKDRGLIQVEHPLETATLLLILLASSLHAIYKMESRGRVVVEGGTGRISPARMRPALEDMVGRVLGVKEYRFCLQI